MSVFHTPSRDDDGTRAAPGDVDFSSINAKVQQVHAAFGAFRERNDSRLDGFERNLDGLNEQVASMRLGGAGMHPAAGVRLPGAAPGRLIGAPAADFHNALRGMPSAAMTTQSGPDGGFTVSPVVDGAIDAMMRDFSPLRSLARVVQILEGDSWVKILGRSGAGSGWVGEEETRPATDSPKLGQVSITPREVYAQPELTNVLLDDAGFDLNAFLQEDVSGELALKEGAAFVSGAGDKQPQGFLSVPVATTADASRAFGTLQYVATGQAGAFASSNPADKLMDLMTALRPSYRVGDGVAWLMNSATANVVRKFKDGQGNYLWTPSILAGQPDRLAGYPVALDENMPDIGANSFSVAFGNWRRGYTIVDKPGIRLIVDRVTKKGWTLMYFSKRVGGGVVDSNAIKLLKFAAS